MLKSKGESEHPCLLPRPITAAFVKLSFALTLALYPIYSLNQPSITPVNADGFQNFLEVHSVNSVESLFIVYKAYVCMLFMVYALFTE